MYHTLDFYIIVFSNLLSKLNSEMVKCETVVLIDREKTDMTDTNMD
jgi:hypothetical protein